MPAVVIAAPAPIFVDQGQGTPGNPSPTGGVMTVQGQAGMYPVLVSTSGGTGPIGVTGPVQVFGQGTPGAPTGSGLVSTATPDTIATGNLNALNATVRVPLAGTRGAGFQLSAGTLIGTIVPEISFDGGSTWNSTYFDNASTNTKVSSIVFASANAATAASIIGVHGTSHMRIRVSAYTSGTAVCNLRSSEADDPSTLFDGSIGVTGVAPPTAAQIAGTDLFGTLRVPQVDKITGQAIQQLSVASTITSPQAAIAGLAAYVTPYGTARVSTEPYALFSDQFAGSALDTNRWGTPTTSGAGAAVTVSNSVVTLTASTTASAFATMTTVPTFVSQGLGFLFWGATVQIEATAVTGQEKFWGLATIPTVPTLAAPLTDAVGFEQDTTGALSAVIYAGGTKIFSQALNRINDGNLHRYSVIIRPDLTAWYYEGIEIPVASVQYTAPNVQGLPINIHVVNGATPSAAGTLKIAALGVTDTAPDRTLSDSTYQWRKATIDTTGSLAVTFGPAGATDIFGSLIASHRSPQLIISFFQAAPATLLTVTTSGSGATAQGTGVGTFSSGVTAGSEAKGVTTLNVEYVPHSEIFAAFTASFTAGITTSFQRIGLYNATDGFSFGYSNATFGLWSRFNTADTFVAQTAWNVDTLSGTFGSKFTKNGVPVALVPTNINLFRIRFGWLGIAEVIYEVLAPDGNFVVVHIIKPTNSQTTPIVSNPNLPMTVDVSNTTGGSNLVVSCSCWVAGTSSGEFVKPNYGGTQQLMTITLASLTNGSARNSTSINNTYPLFEDVLLFFKMTLGASGVSATGYINVYGYGSIDGGTTYPEGITGTDGAATLLSPPNLVLLAQLTADVNGKVVTYGPISFCRQYGMDRMPPIWGVVVVNNSGATFSATGANHFIQYQGVNGQLV